MADPDQLALLKRSIPQWNAWRSANRSVKIDLIGANLFQANLRDANLTHADLSLANLSLADLIGANLLQANLRDADLTRANLRIANLSLASLSLANLRDADLSLANLSLADLIGANLFQANLFQANLRDANLRNANLSGANLFQANLRDADLTRANLRFADLSGADLSGAKRGSLPAESITTKPQSSQPSSTTDWLSLVETLGTNLFVATATLASIIQGLDVVERRWREHKEKQQQQGPPTASSAQQPPTPSQKPTIAETDIVEILLVMDDGSQHGFKRWVADPDALRAYIDAFNDPTSKVKPFRVVFRKRKGRALAVDVTESGKDNKQLNVILGYLEATP